MEPEFYQNLDRANNLLTNNVIVMVTLIVCAEGPGLTLYSIDSLDLMVSRPDECVLIISGRSGRFLSYLTKSSPSQGCNPSPGRLVSP